MPYFSLKSENWTENWKLGSIFYVKVGASGTKCSETPVARRSWTHLRHRIRKISTEVMRWEGSMAKHKLEKEDRIN